VRAATMPVVVKRSATMHVVGRAAARAATVHIKWRESLFCIRWGGACQNRHNMLSPFRGGYYLIECLISLFETICHISLLLPQQTQTQHFECPPALLRMAST